MQISKELGVETDCVLDSILVGGAPIVVLFEENRETGVAVETLRREGVFEGVKGCVLSRGALIDLLSDFVQACLDTLFLVLSLVLLSAVDELLCVCQTALMRKLRGDVSGVQPRNHWL